MEAVAGGREVGAAGGCGQRDPAAAEQQQRGERLLTGVVGQRWHVSWCAPPLRASYSVGRPNYVIVGRE